MVNQTLISKIQVKNLSDHKKNEICNQCGNLLNHQDNIGPYCKGCEKFLVVEEDGD